MIFLDTLGRSASVPKPQVDILQGMLDMSPADP